MKTSSGPKSIATKTAESVASVADEVAVLNSQIAELEAKKKAILDAKRTEALKMTRSNVQQYGFTAQELGLSQRSSKKAVKVKKSITFHDPATGVEWDGELTQKGRKPQWIADRIKAGTIEQFRVKK